MKQDNTPDIKKVLRNLDNLDRQVKRQNQALGKLSLSLDPIDVQMDRALALLNNLDFKLEKLKEFERNDRNDN